MIFSGISIHLLFAAMLLLSSLVTLIGVVAKWDADDIKVRTMVVNALLIVAALVLNADAKPQYSVKLPPDSTDLWSGHSEVARQFARLTSREQELINQHMERTDLDRSQRAATFGEAIERERAFNLEHGPDADVLRAEQSQPKQDGWEDTRQALRQGLSFELLQKDLQPAGTLQLTYRVVNHSNIDLRGLTAGIRLRHRASQFELTASNTCFVNQNMLLKPEGQAEFQCVSKPIPSDLQAPLVAATLDAFEVRATLQYAQLPAGKSVLF